MPSPPTDCSAAAIWRGWISVSTPQGGPHFLECNPLPGLNPDSGDMAILSQPKLAYEHLVQGVLLDAACRFNVRVNGHA